MSRHSLVIMAFNQALPSGLMGIADMLSLASNMLLATINLTSMPAQTLSPGIPTYSLPAPTAKTSQMGKGASLNPIAPLLILMFVTAY
jgi:hypothetical protein